MKAVRTKVRKFSWSALKAYLATCPADESREIRRLLIASKTDEAAAAKLQEYVDKAVAQKLQQTNASGEPLQTHGPRRPNKRA